MLRARLRAARRYRRPARTAALAAALAAGCTTAIAPASPPAASPPAASPLAPSPQASSPRPLQFDATLDCDDGRIATLGSTGHRWVLRVDGREIPLAQAVAASGARWEAVGDASTEVWNKGAVTRLTLAGGPPAECATAAPAAGSSPGPERFVALGHEPAWRLEVDARRLRFAAGPGASPLEAPAPPAQPAGSGRRWPAAIGGQSPQVVALDRVCHDPMSGMPFPLTVRVTAQGRDWRGCGGEPATLLVGAEWIAEDIDRRGVLDRARSSLVFEADGRVTGLAGCHRYAGRWTLSGEALRLDGLAITGARACAPALLDQERRFLERLRAVVRFEIAPDGALRLLDTRDGIVLARR